MLLPGTDDWWCCSGHDTVRLSHCFHKLRAGQSPLCMFAECPSTLRVFGTQRIKLECSNASKLIAWHQTPELLAKNDTKGSLAEIKAHVECCDLEKQKWALTTLAGIVGLAHWHLRASVRAFVTVYITFRGPGSLAWAVLHSWSAAGCERVNIATSNDSVHSLPGICSCNAQAQP